MSRVAAAVEALRAAGIEVRTEGLEPYGHDETMRLHHAPDLVALPRSTPEVSEALRVAGAHGIPVTPRSGGTGKAGGCVPVAGGMVLSLERMDRIKEIDEKNRFAVVEPGVVLAALQERCERAGLLYPIDMSSRGACRIGGNLACNAGGERAVKYGTTRQYVCGIEAVLMDGSVIRTGGKLAKNSAAFPLHHLLVGSEGTLAVITEATLRLLPLPTHRKTLLAAFDSLDAAAGAALRAEAGGFAPSAIELIERAAAALAEEMLGETLPHAAAAALLLVEVEGFSEERTQGELEGVAQLLLESGASDVEIAKRERVWRVRAAIAEAIRRLPAYTAVDTVVPRRRMPELVRRAHEIARRRGVEVVCFGHAGDGNIHVDFVRRRADDPNWDSGAPRAVREVLEATLALGGSISGEHGIGLLRRDDLPLQFDPPTIEAMRALKRAWDPRNLLNPGKIFER